MCPCPVLGSRSCSPCSPQPVAAGSGIPQIKCYLNGVKIPHVVRLKVGSRRWWDACPLPAMGSPLPGWPGHIVSSWGGPCLHRSRGRAGTSCPASLPGSIAVPPPASVRRLNLLPWDRQLALGKAALGNFFALAKKKVGNPIAIAGEAENQAAPVAGWVRVPCGCCGCVPCATHVMRYACHLCFADPGDQSLRGHPLGGRRPGCWEGDVHKTLSGMLLAWCYPLLARVPQPVTGRALGTGHWGPCSDFTALFLGLLAKVTAV